MTVESNHPIVYRASNRFITVAILWPLVILYLVAENHFSPSQITVLDKWSPISQIPFSFWMFMNALSFNIELNDDGIHVSGIGQDKSKSNLRWNKITKITANTSSLRSGISIYYSNMKPYMPLTIHYPSDKSICEIINTIQEKAPQAEFGKGIEEYRRKYSKTNQ